MRKLGYEQEANKGAWTKEEDQKLIDYIQNFGEGCWRTLPKAAGLRRCGKSCRLRWKNYLRPNIKHGNFGQDEEDLIIKLHALLGNRWSLIAGRLPGRTDNEVKNYWHSHIKKKLAAIGIDPNNHQLSQTHPYAKKDSMSAIVATSSVSINDDFNPINTRADHNDQTSNMTSCLEDDTCGTTNLCLNLMIGVTPSFMGQNDRHLEEITVVRENESDVSRTLFLFR